MKPYRVEYVQLAGWEADEVGLWVAENEDWLLLRHIPVDYVIDGYVLLAKAHIKSRTPKPYRKQTEQILRLKGVFANMPPNFRFLDGVEMLRWVEREYGLVEFTGEEDCTFFGWIRDADAVHFWLDALTPKGQVRLRNDDKPPFVISEVQLIRFDTDYFNSIKLFWQHKTQQISLEPGNN